METPHSKLPKHITEFRNWVKLGPPDGSDFFPKITLAETAIKEGVNVLRGQTVWTFEIDGDSDARYYIEVNLHRIWDTGDLRKEPIKGCGITIYGLRWDHELRDRNVAIRPRMFGENVSNLFPPGDGKNGFQVFLECLDVIHEFIGEARDVYADTIALQQEIIAAQSTELPLTPARLVSSITSTPSGKPAKPSGKPSTPSRMPSTPSGKPSKLSGKPSKPSGKPWTPSGKPWTPSRIPWTPSRTPPTPSRFQSTPSSTPPTPSRPCPSVAGPDRVSPVNQGQRLETKRRSTPHGASPRQESPGGPSQLPTETQQPKDSPQRERHHAHRQPGVTVAESDAAEQEKTRKTIAELEEKKKVFEAGLQKIRRRRDEKKKPVRHQASLGRDAATAYQRSNYGSDDGRPKGAAHSTGEETRRPLMFGPYRGDDPAVRAALSLAISSDGTLGDVPVVVPPLRPRIPPLKMTRWKQDCRPTSKMSEISSAGDQETRRTTSGPVVEGPVADSQATPDKVPQEQVATETEGVVPSEKEVGIQAIEQAVEADEKEQTSGFCYTVRDMDEFERRHGKTDPIKPETPVRPIRGAHGIGGVGVAEGVLIDFGEAPMGVSVATKTTETKEPAEATIATETAEAKEPAEATITTETAETKESVEAPVAIETTETKGPAEAPIAIETAEMKDSAEAPIATKTTEEEKPTPSAQVGNLLYLAQRSAWLES